VMGVLPTSRSGPFAYVSSAPKLKPDLRAIPPSYRARRNNGEILHAGRNLPRPRPT
jgi:hypothetical protein